MSGVTGGGRDHGLWHGMRHWQSPKGASQQLNPNAYGTAPAFHPRRDQRRRINPG